MPSNPNNLVAKNDNKTQNHVKKNKKNTDKISSMFRNAVYNPHRARTIFLMLNKDQTFSVKITFFPATCSNYPQLVYSAQ